MIVTCRQHLTREKFREHWPRSGFLDICYEQITLYKDCGWDFVAVYIEMKPAVITAVENISREMLALMRSWNSCAHLLDGKCNITESPNPYAARNRCAVMHRELPRSSMNQEFFTFLVWSYTLLEESTAQYGLQHT